MDPHVGAAIRQHLAQPVDVDLDGIGTDLARQAEELILEQALGRDIAAPPQQDEYFLIVEVVVYFIGVDEGAFWAQMQANVNFRDDVLNGIIKSAVFGVAVSLIAVFEGFDAVPTAEGVSRAITRTVVTSALAILALDFVLTSFMFRGL